MKRGNSRYSLNSAREAKKLGHIGGVITAVLVSVMLFAGCGSGDGNEGGGDISGGDSNPNKITIRGELTPVPDYVNRTGVRVELVGEPYDLVDENDEYILDEDGRVQGYDPYIDFGSNHKVYYSNVEYFIDIDERKLTVISIEGEEYYVDENTQTVVATVGGMVAYVPIVYPSGETDTIKLDNISPCFSNCETVYSTKGGPIDSIYDHPVNRIDPGSKDLKYRITSDFNQEDCNTYTLKILQGLKPENAVLAMGDWDLGPNYAGLIVEYNDIVKDLLSKGDYTVLDEYIFANSESYRGFAPDGIWPKGKDTLSMLLRPPAFVGGEFYNKELEAGRVYKFHIPGYERPFPGCGYYISVDGKYLMRAANETCQDFKEKIDPYYEM